jgi:hypothetical protein
MRFTRSLTRNLTRSLAVAAVTTAAITAPIGFATEARADFPWPDPGIIIPLPPLFPIPMCAGHVATIVGTEFSESIYGTDGDDVIVAYDGNDDIMGGGGDDIICGGRGRDMVVGGVGRDTLYGQAGDDLVGYMFAAGPVSVNLDLGISSGADGRDVIDNFEHVLGSVFDDRIVGNARNNWLIGLDGVDRIYGLAGNDICMGEYRWTCEASEF